jgi:hypothetical protein
MAARLIRRFTEVLGLLDRGKFEQECNVAVQEAIESLEALPGSKGKAKITVELEIAYDQGMVHLTPSLKSKLPETKGFGGTVLWAHEGAFSTQHPSQTDIEDVIRRPDTAAG